MNANMATLELLRTGLREITTRIGRFKVEEPKFAVRAFFTPPNARWMTVFIFVSGLYAANVIQWSIRFGRLAMDPVFDDVGYMIDGLQRLNVLDRAGFHGRFSRLLAIWLFLGLGFALFQRNYRAMLFISGGVVMAAVSVLLISAGQMSDPHFSYTWTILFVLTTLFAVSEIARSRFGTSQ